MSSINPGYKPEGASSPSALEVDSYDNSIGAYRTVAIAHAKSGNNLIPIEATAGGALSVSDSASTDAANTLAILKQMLHLLQPLGIVTGSGSNRISLDVANVGAGTITTVQTVNTVANLRDIGTIPNGGFQHATDLSTMAFQSLRNNIV